MPGWQQSAVVHVAPEQMVVAGYGLLPPMQGKLLPQVGFGMQHSLAVQLLPAHFFGDVEEGVNPVGQAYASHVPRGWVAGFVFALLASVGPAEACAWHNKAATTSRKAVLERDIIAAWPVRGKRSCGKRLQPLKSGNKVEGMHVEGVDCHADNASLKVSCFAAANSSCLRTPVRTLLKSTYMPHDMPTVGIITLSRANIR